MSLADAIARNRARQAEKKNPSPTPIMKFDETGGYDCMTGAWIISQGGNGCCPWTSQTMEMPTALYPNKQKKPQDW